MQPNIKWLDDPRVYRVGQIDAHSDHLYYETEADAKAGTMALCQSLDGVWKFAYSVNPKERPADFWQEGYDVSGFGEIAVPCHIEMAGYDKIHYINTMYPWEGHYYRRPAFSGMPGAVMEGQFSEADYNPVGSYVLKFDLDEALRGKRVVVRFEGDIPGATARDCGNYTYMNLAEAKAEARRYLSEVLECITPQQLVYPE